MLTHIPNPGWMMGRLGINDCLRYASSGLAYIHLCDHIYKKLAPVTNKLLAAALLALATIIVALLQEAGACTRDVTMLMACDHQSIIYDEVSPPINFDSSRSIPIVVICFVNMYLLFTRGIFWVFRLQSSPDLYHHWRQPPGQCAILPCNAPFKKGLLQPYSPRASG